MKTEKSIYVVENLELFENPYYIEASSEQDALNKWYELYGDEYFGYKAEFDIADENGDMIVYELEYD